MNYDILFFSAHPDDAEFGTGGTLLKLSRKYKTVNVVLTHGEAGTFGSPKVREREATAAARFAGASIEFLDFKDNHVEDTVENALKLAAVIRKYKPRMIFAPYHTNNSTHYDGVAHPDHIALGRLAVKAARFAKFRNAKIRGEAHQAQKIIYYMVPRYFKPSFIVDVSDAIDDLRKLWQCHKSQLKIADGRIVERLLETRAYTGRLSGVKYAEAFIIEEPLNIDIEGIMDI